MGVLVIYQLNVDENDLAVIGDALNALPHGRAAPVVNKVQAQINAQEIAARDKAIADQQAKDEAWRSAEREKIVAEFKAKTKPKRRARKDATRAKSNGAHHPASPPA